MTSPMRNADLLSLLMECRPNYTLPGPFYHDESLYLADLERIWYRNWVFAIGAPDIPEAGDFATLQLGSYPILIVRGGDGTIRAFHNSCRHRGSRICSAAKGSAPKIVCPYHQWTYELDGRLLYARDMTSRFDLRQHGLKPVHCRVSSGMVFVCVADEAPSFEPLVGPMKRYMEPHRLDQAKLVHQSTIVEQGNWKLVMENNRECYHCSANHPALCRSFDDNPNIAGSGTGMDSDPDIEAHHRRCESNGLPSRFLISPTQQWRFVRVPLLGDAESYTMDGKVAVQKLLPGIPFKRAGTLLFFHYPNSWNHFLSDQIVTFRMLPVGPTQTEVTTSWYVNQDAVAGKDYNLERLTEVWIATNDEDRRVVEENQRGINSPAYEPGPYSVNQESGVIQFVDWYVDTLKRQLLGSAMMAAE